MWSKVSSFLIHGIQQITTQWLKQYKPGNTQQGARVGCWETGGAERGGMTSREQLGRDLDSCATAHTALFFGRARERPQGNTAQDSVQRGRGPAYLQVVGIQTFLHRGCIHHPHSSLPCLPATRWTFPYFLCSLLYKVAHLFTFRQAWDIDCQLYIFEEVENILGLANKQAFLIKIFRNQNLGLWFKKTSHFLKDVMLINKNCSVLKIAKL